MHHKFKELYSFRIVHIKNVKSGKEQKPKKKERLNIMLEAKRYCNYRNMRKQWFMSRTLSRANSCKKISTTFLLRHRSFIDKSCPLLITIYVDSHSKGIHLMWYYLAMKFVRHPNKYARGWAEGVFPDFLSFLWESKIDTIYPFLKL